MESNVTVVSVIGDFTLPNVQKWRTAIEAALKQSPTVLVSLGLAQDIDLSGIQLLYSVRKTALSGNKEFHLTGEVPEIIAERLFDAGFIQQKVRDGKFLESGMRGFGATNA